MGDVRDDSAGKALSGKLMNRFYTTASFPTFASHPLTEMLSNTQHNLNFIFSPPMSSFAPTAFPPAQPDDPNSPVLFKHNINLVQTQISTVRSLAHEALNAMCVLTLPPRLHSESLPLADGRSV